jgi:predicted dehydrogenase
MRIAIVGCGYVSDHYLETLPNHQNLELLGVVDLKPERAQVLAKHYGLRVYASLEAILDDPAVQLVVNLTDPENHFAVSKASLLAGKHVYSEKPLSIAFDQARELVDLAARQGLLLSSAPCSMLSETAQTMWKAVRDGLVGKVRLVYAELDDNPIYLMRPEVWKNERGTPWPYLKEYETGCTLEHAGYYLTWLAAMFGPASSVTAFSSCQVPDKTPVKLDPPDTPDFSVACIQFKSGIVARLTCSIVAPYDHRLRIIGDEGELRTNECWQYYAPVYFERFTQLNLNARKARSVRTSTALQSLFGVGGRKLKLIGKAPSFLKRRIDEVLAGRRSLLRAVVKLVSKRELVSMDFFRGVAEMAAAIEGQRSCLLPADFVLHVNELTLAIQNARQNGQAYQLTSSFEPLSPMASTLAQTQPTVPRSPGPMTTVLEGLIARLHAH